MNTQQTTSPDSSYLVITTETSDEPIAIDEIESSQEADAALETSQESDIDQPSDTEANEPPQDHKFKTAFKKFWWLAPILGIVLAIGGITVMRLSNKAGEGPATAEQTTPLPVRVTTARSGPIQAWISSEGNVRAIQFKHLAFDTAGEVTYITSGSGGAPLRAGDRVRKGELLAQIDDRDLIADVNKARAALAEAQKQKAAAAANVAQMSAQVAQARSQVQQSERQVSQYRAQVQQTKAQVAKAQAGLNLAQSEFRRYQQVYKEGALSASDLDTRRNAVRDAEADVRAAQAQVNAAQAQVSSAQAQVGSSEDQVRAAQAQVESARQQLGANDSSITTARAQLAQAQVALEGTKLYAPFDGVVAYLNIRQGEYYTPQAVSSKLGGDYQGITESVPIILINPSSFEVIADLPAAGGERVQTGQTTLIGSESQLKAAVGSRQQNSLLDRARAQGQIYAVNPAVSPGGRSIQVKSRITQGNAKLQHGEQVTEWIAVAQKQNAVVAPLNAFVFRDQKPYVFVVNQAQGTVEQRPVELGIEGLTQREILSGVQPGDLLVTEGQNRLVNGAPVKATQVSNGGRK